MSDRDEFQKHVDLIREQEGCDDNKARFIAWSEGASGFRRRMKS